ncbi:hypothetical protein P8452_14109 [Trifolium repens]|nr:hypothetical protein P8452_14109 [Trifolium repens]
MKLNDYCSQYREAHICLGIVVHEFEEKGSKEKLLQSYKVDKERNHGVVVDVGMCRRNEAYKNYPFDELDTRCRSHGGAYQEASRVWHAKDISIPQRTCAWMSNGFMSVNTTLGVGRIFLRSICEQYAAWGIDFEGVHAGFKGAGIGLLGAVKPKENTSSGSETT